MIEKDTLTLRLEGLDAAQQRSRSGFFSATTAALVVLVVFFNITLSEVGKPGDINADPKERNLTMEELKKEEVKRYFGRFTYALPIVGVQIATDDLVFFAPLALLIFCLYSVSCMRNTTKQLKELVESLDATSESAESKTDRLKVGIALKAQTVLNEPLSELPLNLAGFRLFPAGALSKTVNLYQALIFLPALASFAALYGDIYGTYMVGGVFDPEGSTYWAELHSTADQVKVIAFQTIGLVFTLLVLLYCIASSKYAKQIPEFAVRLTTVAPPSVNE